MRGLELIAASRSTQGCDMGQVSESMLIDQVDETDKVIAPIERRQVFALKATTGDVLLNFNPFISDRHAGIAGSYGLYDEDTPNILVDQRHGVLMFSPSVTEGDSAG